MSDIPTDGMSHNCPVTDILVNLIDTLVGDDGEGHEMTPGPNDTCLVCEELFKAEQLLQEVQGE